MMTLNRIIFSKFGNYSDATKSLKFKSINFNQIIMGRLFAVLLIFVFSGVYSQNSLEKIHKHATKVYGIDDLLVNGSVYAPYHPVAFGDPFFVESVFSKGNLTLVGREFENVGLKFDIEQQKVILMAFVDSVNFKIIVLNDNYIKYFSIHGTHFVNISNHLNNNLIKGFYELIYNGEFVFVKSYRKEFLGVYSNRHPNGKYSETITENFIIRNNKKYTIKNKKSIFSVFPEHKNEIKIYMKDNKIKLRKASNINLNNLMRYCDEVSDQ